jgi:integrase
MATKKTTKLPTGFYWKRNTIYYRIWHNQKKYGPFCSETGSIKEAQKHRSEKQAEIVRGEKIATERGVHINDLFDDYIAHLKRKEHDGGEYANHTKDTSSYKASTRIDKNLRPFFGNLKPEPDSLVPQLLTRYKDIRSKQASVSTINTEFRLLRAALKRGVKNKKVNPLHVPDFSSVINEKAEKAAARTGLITPAQYELIMDTLSDHLKPILAAVYFSGVRQKEIKFVRRSQVHFDTHMIDLKAGETKEGDLRVVPMNDQVQEILEAWEKKTAKEYPKCQWFFHFNGEQIGSWKTAWNAALRRVGLRVKVTNADGTPKMKLGRNGKRVQVWKNLVKFHDTRRTNVTSMDELGMQEKDMMKVTGHKTTNMNRRYNQGMKSAERARVLQNAMLNGTATSEPQTTQDASAKAGSLEDTIKTLKSLRDAGVLDHAAFDAAVLKAASAV